jgi:hypothetical protein
MNAITGSGRARRAGGQCGHQRPHHAHRRGDIGGHQLRVQVLGVLAAGSGEENTHPRNEVATTLNPSAPSPPKARRVCKSGNQNSTNLLSQP